VSEKVCAVIPTYNRKNLLRECLNAVLAQTRAPEHVLVVDNASTDGTLEMLRAEFPRVEVLCLPENQGSAGGFHEGMKQAYAMGFDWIWIMDNDTIPSPSALQALTDEAASIKQQLGAVPLLLASKVVWQDGTLHPVNIPYPVLQDTLKFLTEKNRLCKIRFASFASLLIHRQGINTVGFPCKAFFIYADDLEYVARFVRKTGSAFWVKDSVVVHKTPYKGFASFQNPPRMYYDFRNRIWILRQRKAFGLLGSLWLALNTAGLALGFLVKAGLSAGWPSLSQGIWDGLRSGPPCD